MSWSIRAERSGWSLGQTESRAQSVIISDKAVFRTLLRPGELIVRGLNEEKEEGVSERRKETRRVLLKKNIEKNKF